jgi:hypothetical protein
MLQAGIPNDCAYELTSNWARTAERIARTISCRFLSIAA